VEREREENGQSRGRGREGRGVGRTVGGEKLFPAFGEHLDCESYPTHIDAVHRQCIDRISTFGN
jgi:hypothetical protein